MLCSVWSIVRLVRVHKSHLRPWSLSTTAFIPSSGPASLEDRFLTVYLSCFISTSLGWPYVFSFHSLLFAEMFSKSIIAPIFLLALTSSVNAHALIAPALGVKGDGTRNDVQRPSDANRCGNVNIVQNLDTSTPVQAKADGTFLASITDFNACVHRPCPCVTSVWSADSGAPSVVVMVHDP
jgi:hypothetical protein